MDHFTYLSSGYFYLIQCKIFIITFLKEKTKYSQFYFYLTETPTFLLDANKTQCQVHTEGNNYRVNI